MTHTWSTWGEEEGAQNLKWIGPISSELWFPQFRQFRQFTWNLTAGCRQLRAGLTKQLRILNQGVGYVHNICSCSRCAPRCTEGFVRHGNSYHFLYCQLVGKSPSVHFVMHFFEKILVIHILVESNCQRRNSHFGRQFDTASNKRSRERERY